MKEYKGRGRKDDPAAGSHRETERSLREDMKYGKIAVLVAVCTALTTMMSPVAALAEYDTPYVAFGADLTEEQKSEVLDLLEVPSDKVTEDTSLYVPNEEEHRYLDGVLGSDVIGTHALSSCKVVRQEKGHGIHVETHNVTYVTDEMYANALATAGVEDADIVIAAPMPISGTSALVGAVAAWSKMEGRALDPDVILEAARELDISGTIARVTGDADKTAQLIAAVKNVVMTNRMENEEDIRAAVSDVASQIGLEISDENMDTLISTLSNLSELNLDAETIIEQVQGIAGKAMENGLDLSEYGISEEMVTSILDKVKGMF